MDIELIITGLALAAPFLLWLVWKAVKATKTKADDKVLDRLRDETPRWPWPED
ncbi:MAG: hypothetical protein GWN58_58495 [Anaerolineae bacterium]|nr:hypothetical protein [Anaerolineae bacterium]